MSPIQNSKIIFVALICCGVISFTGCQPFQMDSKADGPFTADSSTPMYQIQVVPRFGKPTVSREAIADNMTIQDAIEKSGAHKRFRAMEITLSRIVEGNRRVLKLPVQFEAAEKIVMPEQNYALHPGDTITVKAKAPGSIDKLIGAVTGGML